MFTYQKNAGSPTEQALDCEGIGFAILLRDVVPVFRIVKRGGQSGREEWSGGVDGDESTDTIGTEEQKQPRHHRRTPYLDIKEDLRTLHVRNLGLKFQVGVLGSHPLVIFTYSSQLARIFQIGISHVSGCEVQVKRHIPRKACPPGNGASCAEFK